MIPLKTAKEVKIMREGGKKLAWVFEQLKIKPGMSLKEIDNLAERLIKKQKGKPSFKMVRGYRWATCLNVNQGVVHGVPTDYRLKEGDILSIDIGMFYQGLHTDRARTVEVAAPRHLGGGTKAKAISQHLRGGEAGADKFLRAGQRALKAAIKVAKFGNRVGHISQVIEKAIKKKGYQPIKVLTGHGVGKKLHEPPQIPCYLKSDIKDTEKLKLGMTLAIEILYTQGEPNVIVRDDSWTVETADGKLAALFEDTVAVTEKEPLVLTQA